MLDQGATEVYCCCTHPVLSDPALERINNSKLKKFVTTNTIQLTDEAKHSKKIVQLSIAKIFGQGILNIIDDKSVSELFEYRGRNEK